MTIAASTVTIKGSIGTHSARQLVHGDYILSVSILANRYLDRNAYLGVYNWRTDTYRRYRQEAAFIIDRAEVTFGLYENDGSPWLSHNGGTAWRINPATGAITEWSPSLITAFDPDLRTIRNGGTRVWTIAGTSLVGRKYGTSSVSIAHSSAISGWAHNQGSPDLWTVHASDWSIRRFNLASETLVSVWSSPFGGTTPSASRCNFVMHAGSAYWPVSGGVLKWTPGSPAVLLASSPSSGGPTDPFLTPLGQVGQVVPALSKVALWSTVDGSYTVEDITGLPPGRVPIDGTPLVVDGALWFCLR